MKVEHLTTLSGRIVRPGLLQVDQPTLGLPRRNGTGNVALFRAGRGAVQAGFGPNQWVILIDGEPYSRTPGCGQRGHYFRSGGRWHTNVEPLEGEQRDAVLAAARAALA